MQVKGYQTPGATLEQLGLHSIDTAHWNLTPEELIEASIKGGQGKLTEFGALMVYTGDFTGRSPKDRFIVKDDKTEQTVDWGNINFPISPEHYERLHQKVTDYLANKEIYVRDAYACASKEHRLDIRVVTEYPWSNQFVYNMFLRPTHEELQEFEPEWSILCAPGCTADPETDGTRQENFAVINFSERQILIGGTAYTGEIKKGIFSVLNYTLPREEDVLSMHCSANVGQRGDTAIFFGLSGTGKTTLSADPKRNLIGDDEHGWSDEGVFNFEGGCYAKTIDLSEEREPQIWNAIKHRAILENISFIKGTRTPDFADDSITQNTRVSYPIYHIHNAQPNSWGGTPENIFFLTCDAFGVLPPISRLTPGQAMYHFISGYTAKVAGTEEGVTEPKMAFSACFGAPFLPLHPTIYAEMLGKRMRQNDAHVWLVNTGWTGGPHGTGHRIHLSHTRSMISAALEGQLEDADYKKHEVFGLQMVASCPNVPNRVLVPKQTWSDQVAYDRKAAYLAEAFLENFEQYENEASAEIMEAAPKVPSIS